MGQGEVGGHSHDMPCTWQLPWLDVNGLSCQWAQKPLFSPCRGTISVSVGSFRSG